MITIPSFTLCSIRPLLTLSAVALAGAAWWARRTPRRAAVLLGIHAVGLLVVVPLLYARFLPVLAGVVVPAAPAAAVAWGDLRDRSVS